VTSTSRMLCVKRAVTVLKLLLTGVGLPQQLLLWTLEACSVSGVINFRLEIVLMSK